MNHACGYQEPPLHAAGEPRAFLVSLLPQPEISQEPLGSPASDFLGNTEVATLIDKQILDGEKTVEVEFLRRESDQLA